uniref:Uncharacterized protein n=1 Tax=Poecilia reticulata TaxID=8081 RepID=A0A3P9NH46_POERE
MGKLRQGSPNYGPRAGSGPPPHLAVIADHALFHGNRPVMIEWMRDFPGVNRLDLTWCGGKWLQTERWMLDERLRWRADRFVCGGTSGVRLGPVGPARQVNPVAPQRGIHWRWTDDRGKASTQGMASVIHRAPFSGTMITKVSKHPEDEKSFSRCLYPPRPPNELQVRLRGRHRSSPGALNSGGTWWMPWGMAGAPGK